MNIDAIMNLVEVNGIRTDDLLHAMQALSQLSYTPLIQAE